MGEPAIRGLLMGSLSVSSAGVEPTVRGLLGLAAWGLVAGLAGAGTAVTAARFGPWTALVVVAAIVATVGVLVDTSWAVVAMVLVLPVGLRQVGPLQAIEAAVFVVVAVVGALVLARGSSWGLRPSVGTPLTFAVVSAAVSTAGSPDTELGVSGTGQLVAGAGLMVAVVASTRTTAHLRRLVRIVVVVGAGVSVAALSSVGQVSTAYGGASVSGRAEGIFTQPNELGAFTAAILVLAVGLWMGSRSPGESVIALLSVVVVISALLASLSRGAWVGAVLGTTVVAALVGRELRLRRRLLALGGGLVALAFTAGILATHPLSGAIGERLGTIFGGDTNPHDARPEIYDDARRQIQDAPLFGHGPGTFADNYGGTVTAGRSGTAEHAHNIPLTLAAELGLLGLLAFGALAIAVLIAGAKAVQALRRRADVPAAALCAGAVGALVTVIGHGLVDYPLRNPTLYFFHWMMAGLVLAYSRSLPERRAPERPVEVGAAASPGSLLTAERHS